MAGARPGRAGEVYGVSDGPTNRLHKVLGYTDGINLNSVWDQLDPAEDEAYGYTPTNRLQNTSGPWGELDFFTDAVGNRTFREHIAPGVNDIDAYALEPGTNRIEDVTTNGTPSRALTYDGAGNILIDTKGGVTTTYAYSHAGRLSGVTVGASQRGPYVYNAFGLLASRTMTTGVPASTIHMVYDQDGNLLAEADATTGLTFREYVWFQGRPVAVVDDVDTASPVIYAVHVDHLDRPVMLTDAAGVIVWRATYLPFGEVHSVSGPASIDYRFPGQWFMLETGLAWNWHRWYDASLGRYSQPDPLGMPDGPNRFTYALGSPLMYVDRTGLTSLTFDSGNGVLTVDPERNGAAPYSMPASSGVPGCECDASDPWLSPIPPGNWSASTADISNPGNIWDWEGR